MADLISAEEAQKILANVDDCGACDRQSIVTRLAETVVGLHAEVKHLSTANIDLLAKVDAHWNALRDIARACTLPEEDAHPVTLPGRVRECLRDLNESIERLTAERDRLQRVCDEGLPREHIDCPKCGKQHIDGANGESFATRPHHTHLCQFCGEVFDTGRWSFGADVRAEPVSAETVAMQAEVAPTEQGAP